jgi:enterochelin esterase-like enzyme
MMQAQAQYPQVSFGTIKHLENFVSAYIQPRNVDVWLPPGYDTTKRYAVLYMHDGQMLFDSAINWNRQEWGVDETVGRLIAEGKIQPCIVVGIWNGGELRHSEYFPQKPYEALSEEQRKTLLDASRPGGASVFNGLPVQSDNYLSFLVKELKPFIDKTYSTYSDAAHTFVAGSSMGGLISMYAMCEYPQVFGGAACLSTHWPGVFYTQNNPVPNAIVNYLQGQLPKPGTHKFYFDYGTTTLDSMYKPFQKQVDEVMKQAGYSLKNWMTKVFVGEDHSENAWRKRLHLPVEFLLGK